MTEGYLGYAPLTGGAWEKSPSGLPAISPTRGETTRGARLPQATFLLHHATALQNSPVKWTGGCGTVSPPPCGEGGEHSEREGSFRHIRRSPHP
jgi:hypothetical protein